MNDKQFWEHFGFTQIRHKGHWNNLYWKAPDGWEYPVLPAMTLDNLFKYCVPKLLYVSLDWQSGDDDHLVTVMHNEKHGQLKDKDPAIALRKAIEKAIEE